MGHPLQCYDIIQEGTARKQEFAKDITTLQNLMSVNKWNNKLDRHLINCLIWENKVILVTNPALQIISATKNIFLMNGYLPEEVVGKYPKMFQGELTCKEERKKIKSAVVAQQPFESTILNYRKDGSLYKCNIEGYPIFNTQGKLANFIALEHVA